MEPNWAAEHLQVIRTLMERTAVYRRALAPIMALTGVIGIAAALGGLLARIDSPKGFAIYWLLVSLAAVLGALLLVRREALREREPFWSPPTRRVTQALLPALSAGFILSIILLLQGAPEDVGRGLEIRRLPILWIIFYGCALHAAGFFMPRGMKMFGWAFVFGGCALALGITEELRPVYIYAHGIMGLFFGGFHLAYGSYLYLTEQRKNAA